MRQSLLTEEQIEAHLALLPSWKRVNTKWVERRFRFDTFLQALSFVNQIAHHSEEVLHHPFISIQYKIVIIQYTSWHAGGLTELDFQCAQILEHVYHQGLIEN